MTKVNTVPIAQCSAQALAKADAYASGITHYIVPASCGSVNKNKFYLADPLPSYAVGAVDAKGLNAVATAYCGTESLQLFGQLENNTTRGDAQQKCHKLAADMNMTAVYSAPAPTVSGSLPSGAKSYQGRCTMACR